MESFIQFWENQGLEGFFAIFWFYFILEFPRMLLLSYAMLIAFLLKKRTNKESYEAAKRALWNEHPFVSILIPGKDEGKNYYNMVRSLEEQTYRNYELIIVDDGSTDDSEKIGRELERQGKISLFLKNKERGGKGSASNLALRYARGKYVLHLDADCSLHNHAIEELLIPFYQEEKVGAVGGALEVRNSEASLATTFQTIEYLMTLGVGRMTTSSIGILRIVSGAFGAFRRDILLEVGGWDVGPGMDGDITQKIRRKEGYKIVFTPNAVALTDVPVSFRKLARQRVRWNRSLIRFRLRKHRDILFSPNYNFKFSNFFSSMDNIVFNLVLNITWWIYSFYLVFHFTHYLFYIVITIFLLYTVSKFLRFGIVLFVARNKYDKIRLLPYIPGMTLYTGYFLRAVRTFAYFTETFFHASFKDSWNPEKTSKAAREEERKIERIIKGDPGRFVRKVLRPAKFISFRRSPRAGASSS